MPAIVNQKLPAAMTGSLELATRDEKAVQQDTKRDGDGDAQPPPPQNPESAVEGTEEAPVQNGNDTAESDPAKVWITGWRLYCLILGYAFSCSTLIYLPI